MHFPLGRSLAALAVLVTAAAHSAAANSGENQRTHMRDVHGVDTFDDKTFFQLHDTNQDGFITQPELAHFYRNQGREGDEAGFHEYTAGVMDAVDLNKDGRISYEEARRPAFEDRVFSYSGGGGAAAPNPHGAFESSSWHADEASGGPNRKDKSGRIEYHNVPVKFRAQLKV